MTKQTTIVVTGALRVNSFFLTHMRNVRTKLYAYVCAYNAEQYKTKAVSSV